MLARLFIVLLLAISLSSMRGWSPVDVASPVEILVIDAEPVPAEGEVLAAGIEPPVPESFTVASRALRTQADRMPSPSLGRVFRPPRLLGS